MRPLLKEGGILYIQVNNSIYRPGMSIYHPVIFHPANLEFLLRRLGYDIVARDYAGDPETEQEPFRWWLTLVAQPSDGPRPSFLDITFDLEEFRRLRGIGNARIREVYRDKAKINALVC